MVKSALGPLEADALPRTWHRRGSGGFYFFYEREAVAALLKERSWRQRLRANADRPALVAARSSMRLLTWRQEERQRARMLKKLRQL